MLVINCTLACIKSELKALLLGLEIGTISKLVPCPEVKMSEVCVSSSVNIQLDNEGKTTITVSGFRNIELLMKHWMFERTLYQGQVVIHLVVLVERVWWKRSSWSWSATNYVMKSGMDVALSDETTSLHDIDSCLQGDSLSSVDIMNSRALTKWSLTVNVGRD